METNEIRYFLAVAKVENMHRASETIGLSASSLSKAIRKLETELNVKLFRREGRNIRLTEYGRFLKKRGQDLLSLENLIKSEILGSENNFRVVIAGSETLISHFGAELAQKIGSTYTKVFFEFAVTEKAELFSRVRDGEIDLGLTTYDIPKEFDCINLSSVSFNTYLSDQHVLYEQSKKRNPINIAKVLEHSFVVPQNNILGKINKSESRDGWRDDKFARKVKYACASLKTIEAIVRRGDALAYLPEYVGVESGFQKLAIEGCKFQCKQKIRLFTKNKFRSGWLNTLF